MLQSFKLNNTERSTAPLYIELNFDERKKSRHRTTTACGKEFGWFLERGLILRDTDQLVCDDGTVIQVTAAKEAVSEVLCTDKLLLTKAAYHLGNRHVPLQIDVNHLRYQQDHVLDEMVIGLGLEVSHQQQPFNPENGAYHGKSHGHSHDH